jgi:delta1-piperideine-2-carboxylate reductase
MSSSISFELLAARLQHILEGFGFSRHAAELLGSNCASAERDGIKSHGIFRMRDYQSTVEGGWVNVNVVPTVEDVAPSLIRVDAMNGYAVPALAAATELALEKAAQNGTVVIAIRNSHHLGALSLDVEPFADQGLVALAMTNSGKDVVPHGGTLPVFGTNPLAFASPRASGAPFVFDQASAAMAKGEVKLAMRENRKLPPNVGVNRDGQPTLDPAEIVNGGSLCTFGGHKGAAISIMIELLCAALSGGKFSYEWNYRKMPGTATLCTNQTVILIDPNAGRNGLPNYGARVDQLLEQVLACGQERLPGERRLLARERSLREGIELSDDELAMLADLDSQCSMKLST